jgi:hypothetical protein
MEDDSIDMEGDLKMTVSISEMTVWIWEMTISIWDILSLCCVRPTARDEAVRWDAAPKAARPLKVWLPYTKYACQR